LPALFWIAALIWLCVLVNCACASLISFWARWFYASAKAIDEAFALDNVLSVMARASHNADPFVRIDMEGSHCTDATLRVFEKAYAHSRDIGPVLHPDDLAADKVLALWGRARPRDFYDVRALMNHYDRDQLLSLAASKDVGFTSATFLDALNAINRLTSDDWAEDGIDSAAVDGLLSTFKLWAGQLSTP